jgi:hypothetical protein
MASGAGPRAAGTDGKDFKFRQRVDNHYKLMADARARLTTACRIQQAVALAFVAEGCGAYSTSLPFLVAPEVCAVEAVTLLMAAMLGLGLAKAKDRPEKVAARYSLACTLLLVMFVAQLGYRVVLAVTVQPAHSYQSLIGEVAHCVRRRPPHQLSPAPTRARRRAGDRHGGRAARLERRVRSRRRLRPASEEARYVSSSALVFA